MLKTCLECLAGSRVESEVYGTVLNGQTSTTWPEPHLQNEIMFRLPSSLDLISEIEITGTMMPDPESLLLTLLMEKEKIACQLQVNFTDQKTTLKYNEQEKDVNQSPSHLFPDSEFKFRINAVGEQSLEIYIGASNVGSVELEPDLKDIIYFSLSDNTTKVKELKFTYP